MCLTPLPTNKADAMEANTAAELAPYMGSGGVKSAAAADESWEMSRCVNRRRHPVIAIVQQGLHDRVRVHERSLGVLFGEVVLEDAVGGCPSGRSVVSVVIVEVDEPLVGVGALAL